MITWRFASAADVEQFYGRRPDESMRALVILMDAKPVAILGLAYDTTRMIAFSEYRPELAPHLKSMPVLRAIKAAQLMFCACPRPIVAVREGCSGLLERLGFVHVEGEIYRWRS